MRVIDSHTGGQPTRVLIEGGPELGRGPLSERLQVFAERFDDYRRRCVLEPKCSDAMVGALLCEPEHEGAAAGVIFFNTSGYLGMCGHGTIGLGATLAWLGRMAPGCHVLETPVGPVALDLIDANTVCFENIESDCLSLDVTLDVPGLGPVRGDIAWGGNWFFLVDAKQLGEDGLDPSRIEILTRKSWAVRRALADQGFTGREGAEIDHIEVTTAQAGEGADSRNFVLCPGGAYDRSPCGTGTSAKLACLAARGQLEPGRDWVQESIIGSRFTARYRPGRAGIIPSVTGQAHVFADTRILTDATDPFGLGIPEG
ncbi:proline racemase family protein [Maricaulis parjimensis]|uniref:proline racemase family protein n=1 Tax=Maricaulis parjimensis TaxID=144023 RepID=UPI00193A44C0|nr:proline racemase family protein [Maricaulis parjimensis]